MDKYVSVRLSKHGKHHICKASEDWITLCGRNDQKIAIGNIMLLDENICKKCLLKYNDNG